MCFISVSCLTSTRKPLLSKPNSYYLMLPQTTQLHPHTTLPCITIPLLTSMHYEPAWNRPSTPYTASSMAHLILSISTPPPPPPPLNTPGSGTQLLLCAWYISSCFHILPPSGHFFLTVSFHSCGPVNHKGLRVHVMASTQLLFIYYFFYNIRKLSKSIQKKKKKNSICPAGVFHQCIVFDEHL